MSKSILPLVPFPQKSTTKVTLIQGYTALHEASKKGSEGHIVNLVEYGANPNACSDIPSMSFNKIYMHYKSPLQRARNHKTVQLLLKSGADPNSRMVQANLFISSTIHTDCLLWHTQLIVY